MKNYSIIRVGKEYIVQADDQRILKTTSRRKAARFILEASALLDLQRPAQLVPEAGSAPTISCEPQEVS